MSQKRYREKFKIGSGSTDPRTVAPGTRRCCPAVLVAHENLLVCSDP